MKIKTFVIGYVLALALFLFAQRHTDAAQPGGFRAIVDLTHSVNAKVPTFDVAQKSAYQVTTVATIEKDKYFLRNICLPEHYGHIPPGAVVITRTGWDSRWDSAKNYRNADAKGVMHFPGYSEDAAKFLVEARNVLGLGIDTLSIDYGPSKDFAVHQYTLAHSLYHLENVANLEQAPVNGGIVVVAPMKLEGGSGGPVRIFALVR